MAANIQSFQTLNEPTNAGFSLSPPCEEMQMSHEKRFDSNENFTKGSDANAGLARNFSPNDRDITGIPVYGEAGRKSDYLDNLGFPSSSSLLPTEGGASGGGGGGRNNYDTASGGAYNQGGDATSMRGLENSSYSGTSDQPSEAVDPSSSSYSGGLESSRGGGTKTPQNLWDDIVDFFGQTPND
jgi:hypothetical protein